MKMKVQLTHSKQEIRLIFHFQLFQSFTLLSSETKSHQLILLERSPLSLQSMEITSFQLTTEQLSQSHLTELHTYQFIKLQFTLMLKSHLSQQLKDPSTHSTLDQLLTFQPKPFQKHTCQSSKTHLLRQHHKQ